MFPIFYKWISRLLVIVGLVGIILFFPARLCHQHTSLFEYLMTNCERNSIAENSSATVLLRHYLFPYAFFWWLSIALAVSAIVYVVRQHEQNLSK